MTIFWSKVLMVRSLVTSSWITYMNIYNIYEYIEHICGYIYVHTRTHTYFTG